MLVYLQKGGEKNSLLSKLIGGGDAVRLTAFFVTVPPSCHLSLAGGGKVVPWPRQFGKDSGLRRNLSQDLPKPDTSEISWKVC